MDLDSTQIVTDLSLLSVKMLHWAWAFEIGSVRQARAQAQRVHRVRRAKVVFFKRMPFRGPRSGRCSLKQAARPHRVGFTSKLHVESQLSLASAAPCRWIEFGGLVFYPGNKSRHFWMHPQRLWTGVVSGQLCFRKQCVYLLVARAVHINGDNTAARLRNQVVCIS